MVFSSIVFLFFFLPIFLLVYYLLPNKFKNLFIVVGGYFFYSWGAPRFAFLLLLMISIDYFLSLVIAKKNAAGHRKQSRYLLIFSVLANIGLLVYFKYSNFFVDQIDLFLNILSIPPLPWKKVILPIGISFTVFQELSYIIEVYRDRIKPAKSLIDFAAYLMLFPHVIAGPIVRYIDIAGQLLVREYNFNNFFEGIRRFSIGLAKKVLIANNVSGIADSIFHLHTVRDLSSPLAWLGIIAYAIQIYFDFSGYSDMAIGLAKMIGFDFKENFNKPYIATSVTDFWRRWHISLSLWMKEYLYIPLGGNRISVKRTYLNLWIVFLISGLWHGASWNFLIWGAFHGLFLVFDKIFWLKFSEHFSKFFNIILTFTTVLVAWVFFRIENIGESFTYVFIMFDFSTWFTPVTVRASEVIDHRGTFVLILALLICFLPASSLFNRLVEKLKILFGGFQVYLTPVYVLFLYLLSFMSLVNAQFNPFIYFRF